MKTKFLCAALVCAFLTVSCTALADSTADLLRGFGALLNIAADLEEDAEEEEPDTGTRDIPVSYGGDLVPVTVNGKTLRVHEEFKTLMDGYEAFFDEYVQVMKNPTSSSAISFLMRCAEEMESLDAVEGEDMTDDEALYYAAVSLRIENKLLTAAY